MESIKDALFLGFAVIVFCVSVSLYMYLDAEVLSASDSVNSISSRDTLMAYEAQESMFMLPDIYCAEDILAYLMTDRLEADVVIRNYYGSRDLYIDKDEYNLKSLPSFEMAIDGKFSVNRKYLTDGRLSVIEFTRII